MSEKQQIRLLELWFNHYKVYQSSMDRKDKLAFLKRLIMMGKELQNRLERIEK